MLNLSTEKKHFNLKNWELLSIQGCDSERFLNGQLTNNVQKIEIGKGQLTSRVSRTGTLLSFGYLIKKSEEHYLLLCPHSLKEDLSADLNKFIIMDEVEISEGPENFSITFDNENILDSEFIILFLGQPAGLFLKEAQEDLPEAIEKELLFKYGIPKLEKVKENSSLINQFSLVDTSISKSKGCYVGQETINKIENNRGAGKKEILLSVEIHQISIGEEVLVNDEKYLVDDVLKDAEKSWIKILAKRDIRIEGKEIELSTKTLKTTALVNLLPVKSLDFEELSQNYFEDGVGYFTKNEETKAMKFLKMALFLSPKNPEIIESIGALEGRLGNFEQAILYMDKLEEVEPNSIMACTNRSLYYMKLGKIEEAEEEKSKATLRSFGATDNKEDDKNKKQEMLKRLDMYKQVIDIDDADEMANQGAAQIYFEIGEYDNSKNCIDRLLNLNADNAKALSLLGKILLINGNEKEAESTINKVIDLSSKKGDFVLANEFQALLNSLKKQSL